MSDTFKPKTDREEKSLLLAAAELPAKMMGKPLPFMFFDNDIVTLMTLHCPRCEGKLNLLSAELEHFMNDGSVAGAHLRFRCKKGHLLNLSISDDQVDGAELWLDTPRHSTDLRKFDDCSEEEFNHQAAQLPSNEADKYCVDQASPASKPNQENSVGSFCLVK